MSIWFWEFGKNMSFVVGNAHSYCEYSHTQHNKYYHSFWLSLCPQ